jgi:hypothetical protein
MTGAHDNYPSEAIMNKVVEGHTRLLDHLGKGQRGVGHFDFVHIVASPRQGTEES